MRSTLQKLAGAALLLAATGPSAAEQSGEDFYKG